MHAELFFLAVIVLIIGWAFIRLLFWILIGLFVLAGLGVCAQAHAGEFFEIPHSWYVPAPAAPRVFDPVAVSGDPRMGVQDHVLTHLQKLAIAAKTMNQEQYSAYSYALEDEDRAHPNDEIGLDGKTDAQRIADGRAFAAYDRRQAEINAQNTVYFVIQLQQQWQPRFERHVGGSEYAQPGR